jgi:DNA polymerase-3 subunit beta
MYFKVSRDVLFEKLQLVASILPQRTTLHILENIKITAEDKTLSLSATDLDISLLTSLDVNVEENGSTTVPGKRFLETVRDLPPCEIEIKTVENFAELHYEKGTYKLPVTSSDEYPEIPEIPDKTVFSFPSSQLKNSVLKTSFAASREPGRKALSGIHWSISKNESHMVATDGRKLAFYKCPVKKKEALKMNIPPKALKTLIDYFGDKNIDLNIRYDEKMIGFYLEDATIVARLIEEAFPDYKQVIPEDNDKTLKISRNDLLGTLKRVSIYADTTSHLISFDAKSDSVRLHTETDLGSAEEHLPCDFDGQQVTINFNANYLSEILRNLNKDTVEFQINTPQKAVIITQEKKEKEELIYLLMPIITS